MHVEQCVGLPNLDQIHVQGTLSFKQQRLKWSKLVITKIINRCGVKVRNYKTNLVLESFHTGSTKLIIKKAYT